jgi:hypothetical protein
MPIIKKAKGVLNARKDVTRKLKKKRLILQKKNPNPVESTNATKEDFVLSKDFVKGDDLRDIHEI